MGQRKTRTALPNDRFAAPRATRSAAANPADTSRSRACLGSSVRAAEGMHVEWVDDEAVLLNPETGQIHYLNPAAALVYALILEHGYGGAMQELDRNFGAERVSTDVAALTEDMVAKGILVDD